MIDRLQKTIKYHLTEQNISINAFERKAGLTTGTIQNILHGRSKRPSVDVVYNIARALNETVESLMESETVSDQEKVAGSLELNDTALYLDSAKKIIDIIQRKNLMMNFRELERVIREVYMYCKRANKKSADENFAAWIIDNHLHKINL